MNKLISVIIPNWNGEKLLKKCLNAIDKQDFKDFEVIVVDNGSIDNSLNIIKKSFPGVILINLDRNTGFANAVNEGIRHSSARYIVMLNNDTEVDKYFLKYLIHSIENHKDVGMVAGKMLNFYNRSLIDSAGDFMDIVGHANGIGYGEKDSSYFSKGKYIFLVSGGGSLFKRELFDRVGLLDKDYFAYFEDVDLCIRAQLMGYKAWYEPRSIVYHIHKATSNRNKAYTEFLQFRNMTMTIIKDFPTSLILKDWRWLKIILVHLNTIFYQLKSGYFWAPFLADLWIIFHLPYLLKERARIQSTKVVSDEYIDSFLVNKKITFWKLLK